MTKRALKKLSRLERKFSGPNAGLVWGIWPVWFADPEHPFHLAGVYHDLDYLTMEMSPGFLLQELSWRLGFEAYRSCHDYINKTYWGVDDWTFRKTREKADDDLLANMLEAAGEDKKLIITAHIAYRVVRLLGGFWW